MHDGNLFRFILIFGFVVIIPIALFVIWIKTEDEKLVERFGDEYRDYMKGTGRFIPRSKS